MFSVECSATGLLLPARVG